MLQKNAQQNVQILGLRDREHTNSGWVLITANSKGTLNRQSGMEVTSEQSKLLVESVIIHISHGKKWDESVTGLQVVVTQAERRWPCACLSCTLRLLHPRVMSLWYQFGGRLGRSQGQCGSSGIEKNICSYTESNPDPLVVEPVA